MHSYNMAKDVISLTPRAVAHLKRLLQKNATATGIRLGVKDAGCSGKSYTIDFTSEATTNDSTRKSSTIESITDASNSSTPNFIDKATSCATDNTTLTSIAEDLSIEIEGIKIIVDNASIEYISGTKLDCEQNGLNETLKFINPNVINECGCGESFQVKTRKQTE